MAAPSEQNETSSHAAVFGSEEIPQNREQKPEGFTISFTKKITLAFLAISLLTILSAVGILSFVWEQHFQTYTTENVQRMANSLADSVSQGYQDADGDWYSGALADVSSANSIYDSIHVQVRKIDGTIVYNDSEMDDEALGSVGFVDTHANVASAPIMVDGKQIGTVYVRVSGSDKLLTQADEEFRDKSYQAMLIAAVLAVGIAIIGGMMFARKLVAPIKRITKATEALKEGDYTARTGMRGGDEIARLGRTFDLMADSIDANRKMERQLVTDVAHELRTPLMAIQSTVEAMIDGVFEADEERLETLNSEVRRLSRLVNAILQLSRLENGNTRINKQKIDLNDVAEGVVGTHQAYIEDSGLNFVFNSEPGIYVNGDADLLRQVTANLISNAVRYTPEGGTITVSTHKGDLMGQIQVKDTGIGLTPEEAKLVFQRFWRADAGRTREKGGLGVGLSVVKEIVDQHGGWVRVEGKPNEGACFTVYIPLYDESKARKKKK